MGRMLPTITSKYGTIVYKINYRNSIHGTNLNRYSSGINTAINSLLGEEMSMHLGQLYYKRKDKYYFRHNNCIDLTYDAKTNTISTRGSYVSWIKTELIDVELL